MGWNDIVMKRSTDAGSSWSKLQIVHTESSSKRHVTIGNPSPIVVRSKPGRVVLLGTRDVAEGFRIISDDYGMTWGDAVYVSTPQPFRFGQISPILLGIARVLPPRRQSWTSNFYADTCNIDASSLIFPGTKMR